MWEIFPLGQQHPQQKPKFSPKRSIQFLQKSLALYLSFLPVIDWPYVHFYAYRIMVIMLIPLFSVYILTQVLIPYLEFPCQGILDRLSSTSMQTFHSLFCTTCSHLNFFKSMIKYICYNICYVNHLKIPNSVVSSAFIFLYNQFSEHFHLAKLKLHTC